MRRQIGTVNILLDRVYARVAGEDVLDANTQQVYVEAGVWPVYRDDDVVYWEMTGTLSRRRQPEFHSLGDGLYGLTSGGDELSGNQVIFTSVRYSLDEFAGFRASDPLVVGDASERRLVFELTEEV